MTTGIVQALVIDQDNRIIILHSYMYLGSRLRCVVVVCGVSSSFQLSSLPLHNETEGFKEKCYDTWGVVRVTHVDYKIQALPFLSASHLCERNLFNQADQ